MHLDKICVFCGSYSGGHPEYAVAAEHIGVGLAQRGVTLVYGGGKVGLMGTVAKAAMSAGGKVIGVMPQALVDKELAYTEATELHVVQSMHERKALMAELSDAFITLPGGFGTMDELFEIITWAQLGFHRKPVCLLNVRGYFDPLLALVDHMVQEAFIKPEHSSVFLVGTQPAELLEKLAQYEAPLLDKWQNGLKREEL